MSGITGKLHPERLGGPYGALAYVGRHDTVKTSLSLMEYGADSFRSGDLDTEDLKGLQAVREGGEGVRWLNVCGLADVEVVERIGRKLGIHRLVLQNILHTGQRPSAEVYEGYIFLALNMIEYREGGSYLDSEQVSVILGPDYVVTFQEKGGDVFDRLRLRIRNAEGCIRSAGADYLAYSILDAVVDHYFLALENLGEEVESLEDRVIARRDRLGIARIHRLKRKLIFMRKSAWPLREELGVLLRGEHPLLSPETVPYFRDLYGHTVEVMDTVETFRDMASGLLEVYLSSQSNRLNEVMKVLTIIATIFIPITFITGVYGMNFRHMPELELPWAYPACLVMFVVIAGGMLVWFRRKGWL
ncbi:MAG: magnesium/cobalt transporter CorA [Candidatus Fermentibacteraceae bacterium]